MKPETIIELFLSTCHRVRESVQSAVGRAVTSLRRGSLSKSSCESSHSKCLQVLALHRDENRDLGHRIELTDDKENVCTCVELA